MTAAALKTNDVTAFGDACEFTGIHSRDRAGWLGLRRSMLTASDMASVLNLDDDAPGYARSSFAVYVEKVTACPEPDIIDMTPADIAELPEPRRTEVLKLLFNDPRFWGSRLEQPILSTVAEYSGWEYREGGALLRSLKYPWLGCTLDSEIKRLSVLPWEIGEGKTTKIVKGYDEETGELPRHVSIQAQTQILVTGAPMVRVIAQLQGCRNIQIEIEPHEKFQKVLIEESEAFMDRVQRADPPDPDWRDSSKDALHRYYSGEMKGALVDLPREAVAWTKRIIEIANEAEKLDREDKYLRNMIRHKIGEATYGILAEPVDKNKCWRWQTNKAGQRVLSKMKKAPVGSPYGWNLPAPANDPLVDDLIASVEHESQKDSDDDDDVSPAPPIRFSTSRKRAKR